MTIGVRIVDAVSPNMIDRARPLHTGSPRIVVAHKIVVREVTKIGFSLVQAESTTAHFFVHPFARRILVYSTRMMAFPTTIHAKAITQIIDVAEKYSFVDRKSSVNPGKTPINPSKNETIIVPPI